MATDDGGQLPRRQWGEVPLPHFLAVGDTLGVSRVNRSRLRELVSEVGPSARAISIAAGLGSTAIRDILSGKSRDPGAATLTMIANALDVDVSALMEDDPTGVSRLSHVKLAPRFLPVRYKVHAGHWFEVDTDEPPEQVALAVLPDPRFDQFPQWLEKVEGDSVDLKIPDGHYAHVVDAGEMGYTPKNGDWVVVERHRDDGAIRERTIKQVEVTSDGRVRLWPRSSNPKWNGPLDYTNGARPGESIAVFIVGLVVSAIDADF